VATSLVLAKEDGHNMGDTPMMDAESDMSSSIMAEEEAARY